MLPVLSSLTELLGGTVTEEFKKLLKPAPLVTAGIFLTLNLVLIFPLLVAGGVAPFVSFERLPAAWQLALGTLVLLALGYLVNSLKGFFLNVATGNGFEDSPLVYDWLKGKQEGTFDELKDAVENQEDTEQRARAAYRLAYEFPQEREVLASTRLGNALLSVSSYIRHQYGAHLDTLWSLMDPILQKQDEKLHTRVSDSRASLDFLATLAVLLVVVAIELVIVGPVFRRPLHAIVGTPITLIAAYTVYRAAVKTALAWGRNVRAAFDLHLDAVGQDLGLRDLPRESFTKRKGRWEDVCTWLAYGAVKFEGVEQAAQKEDWYKAPPAPVFEVKHPPTINVEKHRVFRSDATPVLDKLDTEWFYGRVADYVFVIANMETGQHAHEAAGACLIVTDSKLLPGQKVQGELFVAAPSAAAPPSGKGKIVQPEWHPGDPPALFWPLGDIPPRSSYVLRYAARHDDELSVELTQSGSGPFKFRIESLEPLGNSDRVRLVVANDADDESEVKVTVTLLDGKTLARRVRLVRPKRESKKFAPWAPGQGSLTVPVKGKTSFALVFTRMKEV